MRAEQTPLSSVCYTVNVFCDGNRDQKFSSSKADTLWDLGGFQPPSRPESISSRLGTTPRTSRLRTVRNLYLEAGFLTTHHLFILLHESISVDKIAELEIRNDLAKGHVENEVEKKNQSKWFSDCVSWQTFSWSENASRISISYCLCRALGFREENILVSISAVSWSCQPSRKPSDSFRVVGDSSGMFRWAPDVWYF